MRRLAAFLTFLVTLSSPPAAAETYLGADLTGNVSWLSDPYGFLESDAFARSDFGGGIWFVLPVTRAYSMGFRMGYTTLDSERAGETSIMERFWTRHRLSYLTIAKLERLGKLKEGGWFLETGPELGVGVWGTEWRDEGRGELRGDFSWTDPVNLTLRGGGGYSWPVGGEFLEIRAYYVHGFVETGAGKTREIGLALGYRSKIRREGV